MSKKMVLLWKDGFEGRSDLVYNVDEEGFERLATNLAEQHESDEELPKLELAWWTPAEVAEAERIGEEMA